MTKSCYVLLISQVDYSTMFEKLKSKEVLGVYKDSETANTAKNKYKAMNNFYNHEFEIEYWTIE